MLSFDVEDQNVTVIPAIFRDKFKRQKLLITITAISLGALALLLLVLAVYLKLRQDENASSDAQTQAVVEALVEVVNTTVFNSTGSSFTFSPKKRN